MGRFWSLFFLLVPILGVAAFAAAPAYNYWLPVDISAEQGADIDQLFYFILGLMKVDWFRYKF